MNVNRYELIQRLSIRLAPMLVPCLLLAVGVGCSKKEAPPPPPPEVQVTEVVRKDVPILFATFFNYHFSAKNKVGKTLKKSEFRKIKA